MFYLKPGGGEICIICQCKGGVRAASVTLERSYLPAEMERLEWHLGSNRNGDWRKKGLGVSPLDLVPVIQSLRRSKHGWVEGGVTHFIIVELWK